MTDLVADMRPRGVVATRHFMTVNGEKVEVKKVLKAPLSWKLKNTFRVVTNNKFPYVHIPFIEGFMWNKLSKVFSKFTGIVTMTTELSIRTISKDGLITDYGVVGYKSVTDAGVAYMVDDWDDDTTDITILNFHAAGTGVVAENVTDTALGAESTTITDRFAGTKSQPSANQIRSVATLPFTGAGAITEHGIFHIITESTGTLWDRTVFSAINVANLDSIEFTYTLTITAGG